MTIFGNPLLLGFDEIEHALARAEKFAADGYPPYNIEQIGEDRIRIVVAVAGFSVDMLQIERSGDQLTVRGRHAKNADGAEHKPREFLHRGIATRQFQRSFLLADGMTVENARLEKGLLTIELLRPEREEIIELIPIEAV